MDRTTETHTSVYEDAEGEISQVSGHTHTYTWSLSLFCEAVGVCWFMPLGMNISDEIVYTVNEWSMKKQLESEN